MVNPWIEDTNKKQALGVVKAFWTNRGWTMKLKHWSIYFWRLHTYICLYIYTDLMKQLRLA